MEDLRLGCRSVANQFGIVHRHPDDLSYEADVRPATSAQVTKIKARLVSERRKIELSATNQVHSRSLGDKRHRQAKYIGPVAAASKQGHRDLRGHIGRDQTRPPFSASTIHIILTELEILFYAAVSYDR